MEDRVPENSTFGTVVLVHGLWLHGVAFVAYRHWLGRRGFATHAFSYPSVRRGLDANSVALARCVAAIGGDTVHLVGHSLGGLVALNMLAQTPDPRIRRVVLMGSPCGGSYCAARLLRTRHLATIVGRSIRDAMTRTAWTIPEDCEVGVLAGNRSFGLGRIVPGLPRPNDGVVAVDETRLAGCSDEILLSVSHSEMLISSSCADQVVSFLTTGRFRHDGTDARGEEHNADSF